MKENTKVRIYKDGLLIKECNSELVAITWLLMKGYIFTGHGWHFLSPKIKVVRDFNATWETFDENA